jgi:hypothetical protein
MASRIKGLNTAWRNQELFEMERGISWKQFVLGVFGDFM